MGKWYAVKAGRKPGVYTTWEECKQQTDGFSGAIFKSFNSYLDATTYMGTETGILAPNPPPITYQAPMHRPTPTYPPGYSPTQTARSTSVQTPVYQHPQVPVYQPTTVQHVQVPVYQAQPESHVVYTDGSCQHGRAGYAFYYRNRVVFGPVFPATNNRGELAGAIRALECIPDRPIIVKTDSMYVINAITKWIQGWARNGWKTASGTAVLNVDLLTRLHALSKSDVTYQHVSAHSGIRGNEIADVYAKRGCFEREETTDTV